MEPGSRREEEAVEEQREVDDLTLRRAQRGEERACRDLVAHYQGPVFALLGRLLSSARRRDVEALAEETFVRVLRDLPRFSIVRAARLSSFVLTVATRLALEKARRRRLRSGAAALDPAEPADAGAAVRRAAAALPVDSRAALLLRDFHHLELQEIARALEIDVGAVRTRLGLARAAIRAAVGEGSTHTGASDG
jgi:RNA polymerase sigma-70 factor, ECF subfamily